MHILAVEGWPTLLAGGQERSFFEVVSDLRARGVAVTLAYEEDGELVPAFEAQGVETFKIPTRALVLNSVRCIGSVLRFARSLLCVLRSKRRSKTRWTLIYINQCFDVVFAVACSAILRIPIACHLRVAPPHYFSRQFRWGLKRCRLLICNSRFTAQAYVNAGVPSDRMVVLHNSIDTRVFCPADEGEAAGLAGRPTRLVLYVGRLSPEKGIETLIRAVRISRSRDSRIRLLVVGNARGYGATASYLEQLKVFADSLLGGAAEFRPAMSDVVGVYRSADITVLPTIWEEAFGRVIIESMACGIPCLASRSGGVPEILTGELGDLLFDKGNAEDLSSKIDKYVDWRLVNPEISVLCRTKVLNEFSSEVGRDRLLKVLKEASGEEAQSP